MDIRLNGKALLGILTLSAGLAFGDFVTLIDSKSSGGYIIKEIPVETATAGSVVLRLDDINPGTIYGGTWELITGDASLRLGNGANLSGRIEGSGNDPVVPLQAHSHTKGTMEITGTLNNISQDRSSGIITEGAFSQVYSGTGRGTGDGQAMDITFAASNSWTGETSVEGTSNATLDVRGNYLKVNVWKKLKD